MKKQLKAALRALAPKPFDALMTMRSNSYGQRVMAQQGIPAIMHSLVERHGAKVLGGPFAGMAYLTESAGSSFVPKLLGSYECELHPVLEHIVAFPYDTIVDVGSAEGYYAVGLALRMPDAPEIIAYDINPKARRLCRELAQMNFVADKIRIEGLCEAATLQTSLRGHALVLCDCEGYETELLQPTVAPCLLFADILVELHDCLIPGLTQTLVARFESSHDIALIDSVERNPSDYPVIDFLTPERRRVALSEFRHGTQQWAFMTPKK